MIIVSDTSPLISLMKASLLDVLQRLFDTIIIPEAVFSELTTNPDYQDEAEQIKAAPFITVVSVKEHKAVDVLRRATGLDLGESEAIVYADENSADVLLMDEAAGRRVAKSMGLRIVGSSGILLAAYDERILTAEDVDAAVDTLKSANRRISEELVTYARAYVRKQ